MTAATGHCELCDLPLAYCEHGRPAPEPAPSAPSRRSGSSQQESPGRKAASSGTASSSARSGSRRQAGVTTRSVGKRRTPPEELRPAILAVLGEAGRALEAEEMIAALEDRVGDDLRSDDRETTPAGEPRWQYAARRARQALIGDGLLVDGGPRHWELTDEGRAVAPGPAAAPPANE